MRQHSPYCCLGAVLQAITSALLMNVYIVGLNQLFDIEIDKVGDLMDGLGGLAGRWVGDLVAVCGTASSGF